MNISFSMKYNKYLIVKKIPESNLFQPTQTLDSPNEKNFPFEASHHKKSIILSGHFLLQKYQLALIANFNTSD